jgi:hypothetical protein
MGYFNTRSPACPNCARSQKSQVEKPATQDASSKAAVDKDLGKPVGKLDATVPQSLGKQEVPPPISAVQSKSGPLSVRLKLPALEKPIIKQQSGGKFASPISSVPGKGGQAPRECKMKYTVGASVPGFGGATQATFVDLRKTLAEAERQHAAKHADDPSQLWSTAPIIGAAVGADVSARSKLAISELQKRKAAIEKRLQSLPVEQQEKFKKNLQSRIEFKIFAMSSSAMRPGSIGQPGRDAIREGLAAVGSMKGKALRHTDVYFGLNKAMAVDDQATGAKKDQFGKLRDKEVALPVLGTGEPRTDGMPKELVTQNLALVDQYVAEGLGAQDTDPIELIAKQYMLDVTIHPCIDANGRSSLMATFPLAETFGLPWPLVTKKGSNVFHCQNGQAADGHALHPAEAMAFIVEGMSANLDLQEQLLDQPDATPPCSAQDCGKTSWVRVTHQKCGYDARFCETHLPLATCPKCGDIGILKEFVQ